MSRPRVGTGTRATASAVTDRVLRDHEKGSPRAEQPSRNAGGRLSALFAEPLDRDAELLGLVGEVGGDARAWEHHDADRQDRKQLIVALERRRLAVAGP